MILLGSPRMDKDLQSWLLVLPSVERKKVAEEEGQPLSKWEGGRMGAPPPQMGWGGGTRPLSSPSLTSPTFVGRHKLEDGHGGYVGREG
jgi:hypothetical protein